MVRNCWKAGSNEIRAGKKGEKNPTNREIQKTEPLHLDFIFASGRQKRPHLKEKVKIPKGPGGSLLI